MGSASPSSCAGSCGPMTSRVTIPSAQTGSVNLKCVSTERASLATRLSGRSSCTASSWACCHSDMTLRILLSFLLLPAAMPAARLKDLASIEGVRENQLIGYGLVVGLAGTGDRRQATFSAQSLTNTLER